MDRGRAFGCEEHDEISVQREMPAPIIIPGVEQGDEYAGFQIFDPRGAPFPKIAADASVGEVQGDRFAAVFPAEDVINVVRVKGVVFVGKQYSDRRPARSAMKSRSRFGRRSANGEIEPRASFGHDHEMLEQKIVLQFRLILRRDAAIFRLLDEFGDSLLSLD
jgi:hypothetical protein